MSGRSEDVPAPNADGLVEKNLNWNFTVNVLDNMFFALAISPGFPGNYHAAFG